RPRAALRNGPPQAAPIHRRPARGAISARRLLPSYPASARAEHGSGTADTVCPSRRLPQNEPAVGPATTRASPAASTFAPAIPPIRTPGRQQFIRFTFVHPARPRPSMRGHERAGPPAHPCRTKNLRRPSGRRRFSPIPHPSCQRVLQRRPHPPPPPPPPRAMPSTMFSSPSRYVVASIPLPCALSSISLSIRRRYCSPMTPGLIPEAYTLPSSVLPAVSRLSATEK